MSRNDRIQKRQTATRKQKARQESKPALVRTVEIDVQKILEGLVNRFRNQTGVDLPEPVAPGPSLDKVGFATEGANPMTESPSIQNQAQLADKWAYEVRTQLSALLRRVGGSDILASIAVPEPAEMAPGLRGTLDSTTRSLSQSLDLLSTLRCMVG